jgi:Cof subfamily protein (haloacid dehalogenase superfamily)
MPSEKVSTGELGEPDSTGGDPWLVAIDLDGTTVDEAGTASAAVVEQLRRIEAVGHQVLIATGRSATATLPVLNRIGVWPEYLVCSNGGAILRREATESPTYRRMHAAGFDAAAVVQIIRTHLPSAQFAVEDETGGYRYTHPFPPATTEDADQQLLVPFEGLLDGHAVRVVAIVPGHDVTDFRARVERMNLTGVTFSLGWTAWLDIAAEGTTKAAAAETVRAALGVDRKHVMAVGDGFNDIEFLAWAGAFGRGVAMGHAPDELRAVASEITGRFDQDGLAQVLATL